MFASIISGGLNVNSDDLERTLGTIANDANATLVSLKRMMRERLPPTVARTAARDSAAGAVAQRLHDVDVAFADAAIEIPVGACECCTDPAFVARLETVPAMQLSEEDMAEVVASLSYTLGSLSDVPYFVPRWCADGLGSPLYDVTQAFARAAAAGFAQWPTARRDAIRDFLAAQLRYVLGGPTVRFLSTLNDVQGLYECAAYLGFDEAFFSVWELPLTEDADEHLPDLLAALDVDDNGDFSLPCAWAHVALDKLIAWFRTPRIRARLEHGLSRDPAPDRVERQLVILNESVHRER